MHVKYILLLFAGMTCASSHAFADPKAECIAAADQGQSARDDGRYKLARDAFATCSRSVCPRPIIASCTKWARELDDAMPTVVISAKDASGNDLTAVHVTDAGKDLATSLDGKPIDIDPGAHKLHFASEGTAPVDQTVVVKAGEKLRAINVALKPTADTKTETEPKPIKTTNGNGAKTATTVVLGVFGVGGLALGVSMGFASQGDADNAQSIRMTMPANACTTNPTTAPCQNLSAAVDAQNRDAAISVAMYVTGGLFAVSAVLAWVLWPKSPDAEADHPTVSLVVGPVMGLRGTF